MTACILDLATSDEADLDPLRAKAALAVSVLKSRLESRGVPCVLAGGPYHPAERIASQPALARRLLHAGIEGGATFLVLHFVGATSAELVDHLIRYLDAIVAPPRPVVLLANADCGTPTIAATLRAREALLARGRAVKLAVWSESDDSTALALISQTEAAAAAAPAHKAWTLPLRSHVHARILRGPLESPAWRLDMTSIRASDGVSVIEIPWSDLVARIPRPTSSDRVTSSGEFLGIAHALADILRESHASSVALPSLERELESCVVEHLQALPEALPIGLDGDDLGALSGLVMARAMSDTTHMPFHALGRRKVGSRVRCWRPFVESCPLPPATSTFARWIRETEGSRLIACRSTPIEFHRVMRDGSWPSDRAHAATGDFIESLAVEASTLGLRFNAVDG